MDRKLFFAFLVPVVLAVAGCANDWTEDTSAANIGTKAYENAYRIGVGDIVQIDVWGNPNLSTRVPVRPDGMISMPLLGDVLAGGLTSTEMAEQITTSLAVHIRNPEVVVILAELRSDEFLSRVRVTGAVVDSISMTHRQGMTVLDAILEAGGVTEFASADKATLFRKKGDETLQLRVKLNKIMRRGDLSTNYELMPGDIISVPERIF